MQLYRGMDIGTAKLTRAGARRRPAPPAGHLGRHRGRQRRRVPAAGPRRDRPAARRGPHPGPGRRLRAVRTGAIDALEFPGTDPAVRARLEAELDGARLRAAARPAGRRRPGGGPRDPAEQRPPDRPRAGGHRDHRAALHRQSARPRGRLRHRADRRRRRRAPSSTSGSRCASTGCGRPGWWTRCAPWRPPGCARAAPPPGRSATSRCSPRSRGSAPRTRRAPRRCAPPSASRAARTRGSAATRGSTG